MKIIRTLVCKDGVIGLNGWQYLLNADNTEMKFSNTVSANKFLLDNGYKQEYIDEYIEIITERKQNETND